MDATHVDMSTGLIFRGANRNSSVIPVILRLPYYKLQWYAEVKSIEYTGACPLYTVTAGPVAIRGLLVGGSLRPIL